MAKLEAVLTLNTEEFERQLQVARQSLERLDRRTRASVADIEAAKAAPLAIAVTALAAAGSPKAISRRSLLMPWKGSRS